MGSPREKFGKAGEGSGFVKHERWQLSAGTETLPPLRIFPPMHSLQGNERGWACFHSQHFGFLALGYKDKTKTRAAPFGCVEKINQQTEMVEVSCAECRDIEIHEKQVADREAFIAGDLKKRGILDEKTIDNAIKADPTWIAGKNWLQQHNLDRKWYINCVDQAGKLGVLKIAHKHKQALEVEIARMRKGGFEPINDFDSGCYFVFSRSGKGSSTIHSVIPYFEPGATYGQQTLKMAPLSDELLEKALTTLPDLTTVVKKVSPEQVKLLVESDGSPEVVETILNMTQRKEGSPGFSPPKAPAVNLPPALLAQAEAPTIPVVLPPPPAPVAPPVAAPVVAAPRTRCCGTRCCAASWPLRLWLRRLHRWKHASGRISSARFVLR
jgi:hypothetical protein